MPRATLPRTRLYPFPAFISLAFFVPSSVGVAFPSDFLSTYHRSIVRAGWCDMHEVPFPIYSTLKSFSIALEPDCLLRFIFLLLHLIFAMWYRDKTAIQPFERGGRLMLLRLVIIIVELLLLRYQHAVRPLLEGCLSCTSRWAVVTHNQIICEAHLYILLNDLVILSRPNDYSYGCDNQANLEPYTNYEFWMGRSDFVLMEGNNFKASPVAI